MKLLLKLLSPQIICQISFNEDDPRTLLDLYQKYNINQDLTILVSNGRNLDNNTKITELNDRLIECRVSVKGGKGGFGTLLRKHKATKKQTTNNDDCRDITGKRMRHINQAKKLEKWRKKIEDEDKIIKKYNNANDKTQKEIKDVLNNDKYNDITRRNRKYINDDIKAKKSVGQAFQFLKRKRLGTKNKNNKLKKRSKQTNSKDNDSENEDSKEDISCISSSNEINNKEIRSNNFVDLNIAIQKQNQMSKEELLEEILDL